jgi:hypothetical protein
MRGGRRRPRRRVCRLVECKAAHANRSKEERKICTIPGVIPGGSTQAKGPNAVAFFTLLPVPQL